MNKNKECLVIIKGEDPYIVKVSKEDQSYVDYKTPSPIPFTLIRMNNIKEAEKVYCCIASDEDFSDRHDEARKLLSFYDVKPLNH